MGPSDVRPFVFIHVVRNMAVLAQRMSLHRFLVLLLDLAMLLWSLCLDILALFRDRLSSLIMILRLIPKLYWRW